MISYVTTTYTHINTYVARVYTGQCQEEAMSVNIIDVDITKLLLFRRNIPVGYIEMSGNRGMHDVYSNVILPYPGLT